ncbi:MAG: CHASE2 domain-containing protein [Rhodocyclaceae bacterium]|nr:CHASE2 domain-containing protein [Rhodocyclaceae bacterium]
MINRSTVEWSLVALTCALAAALATGLGGLWRIDQAAYDAAMSLAAPTADEAVTIVAIDDPSLAEIGRWPWRRTVHAALIERLSEAGARAIALDIIFHEPNPERPEDDAALAAAIAASGKVVLPVVQASRAERIIGEAPPAPPFAAGAAGVGHIHVELDPDGIARSVYLWEGFGAARYPQFGLAVLQLAEPARAAAYPPPEAASAAGWQRAHWLRIPFAGPPGSYRHVSYADVLRGDVDPALLRDKIVFVGATAAGMADSVPTPTSGLNRPMSGVEVNATVYAALKRGAEVHLMPAWLAAALAATIVLALMAAMLRAAPRGALLLAFVTVSGALLASWGALQLGGVWFPPAGAILGCLLCYPLWSWRRLEAAQRYLDAQLEILDRDAGTLFPAMRAGWPNIRELDPLQARIRRVTQAVERQRDLHRFVADTLDHLPVGVVVIDPAQAVLLCNRQAMALLDVGAPTAVAAAVIALDWPPGTALEGGVPAPAADGQAIALELDAPGGVRLLASVAGVSNAAGERIGVLLGLSDITRIHDAQRSREETMHYLSHDLRSPIASILTLIEAEKGRDQLAPDGREFLRQLGRYAHSALKLADDLFRLVRAEAIDAAGFAEFDLAAVVQDAADELWALARAKDVRILVDGVDEADDEADDEAAFAVHGDRELVRRALVNLLGNAVKYGPPHSDVRIAIRAAGSEVAVAVSDGGDGIRHDLLPQLFRRFGRLPTRASRRESGLGLGLMIVKTVAERHGGRVAVESRPGVGCTFTLTLPAAHPAARPRAA